MQLDKETIPNDRNKLKEWLEGAITNGLVFFIQRELLHEKRFFWLSEAVFELPCPVFQESWPSLAVVWTILFVKCI